MKKHTCIGACLVVLTLIACQLSPGNSAPNTQEDFKFSEDWKSRQALVPVALGREPADVVVKGGQVFIAQTGELKDGWIIATKGKRIAYLGPEGETPKAAADQKMIAALVGPETKVLDASGQTLVPGFGHSHHPIDVELGQFFGCSSVEKDDVGKTTWRERAHIVVHLEEHGGVIGSDTKGVDQDPFLALFDVPRVDGRPSLFDVSPNVVVDVSPLHELGKIAIIRG